MFELLALAASVMVLFDDPVNVDVNYRVYVGTNSGTYFYTSEIGTAKSTTVTGLGSGRRYYFAVKAYAGTNESAFSNEATHTTPIAPPISLRTTNVTQAAMSINGPWTNVAMHVVDIPEGYQFSRVEIRAGVSVP